MDITFSQNFCHKIDIKFTILSVLKCTSVSDGINSVYCFVEKETENSPRTPCPRPLSGRSGALLLAAPRACASHKLLKEGHVPQAARCEACQDLHLGGPRAKDKQEQSANSLLKSPFQIPVSSRRMSYVFRLAPRVPQTDSSKSINQGNSCSKP